MSSIFIRPDTGGDMLTLEGASLAWGAPGQKRWTGVERIKLHLADGSRLVFDITEAPAFGEVPIDASKRTLTISSASDLVAVPGSPASRRLPKGKRLFLRFHWANPLTPSGAGIFFELIVVSRKDHLELAGDPADDQSGTWYAERRDRAEPSWRQMVFDQNYTFDVFANQALEYLDYLPTERHRLPALFGGSASSAAWLADLREETKLRFRLGPRQPRVAGDPVDQPYSATMFVPHRDDEPLPVSSRALGGDGDSVLGRALLTARDLNFRCARARGSGAVAGNQWVLDWHGISGTQQDDPYDQLTLPTLWRHLVGHYVQGLSATRSRNRFSAMPTRLSSDKPIILRFAIDGDVYGDAVAAQLRQVGLGSGATVTAQWGGAVLVDGSAPLISFTVDDAFHYESGATGAGDKDFRPLARVAWSEEPFATDCLGFAMRSAPKPLAIDWLLGGVRTRATRLDDVRMSMGLQADSRLLERRAATCDVAINFSGGALSPVGQDPEPGFETLLAWRDRPQPISIDLAVGSTGRDLNLSLTETANAEQSRIVRLRAQWDAANGRTTLSSDVAIIDPTPLTVARVIDTIEIEPDAIIAEYTDDSENPAGWEFRAGDGAMTIVLPPQTVGEEMIKGRLGLRKGGAPVEVPRKGKPFQVRLGQNASLLVDRTDIDTSRAPPPWMLRRLLARRLGVTGLKLKQSDFELVYGLSTRVKTKGLRIAELDALIGRVPLADPLVSLVRQKNLKAQPIDHVEEVRQNYAVEQARWILDLMKRPSWWPMFRDAGTRERLTLREDVTVTVRDLRETANPFQIDAFASPKVSASANAEPLRGGVDWLFQSRAIYDEFLRRPGGNPAKPPTSVAALVEGVAFGPLGGEGTQTAEFANGKTIIISKTNQGHLESLVLMRIGRIAQYWNRARHVIVYQRSRRTAPRYRGKGDPYQFDTYDEQLVDFDGFMALRKVREYVEITQPRRPQFDDGPGAPPSGPLGQSTFETTIIPVKASWARDIDRGQLVTLRGPIAKDEERFFPRPLVFIEGARAKEKGGGLVPNEVEDPSQLFFFTSTREQDGADTDAWPAWPDIDAPVWAPRNVEQVDYRPSFRASRQQPNARRATVGARRFTLDLVPNQEAVNLMHGRQDNAIEARLMNVSVARALPPIQPAADTLAQNLGSSLAASDAYVADKLGELRAYAREHGKRVTDLTSPEHQQFVEDAATLVAKLSDPIAAMKQAIDGQTGKLATYSGKWTERQKAALGAYASNASGEIAGLAEQLKRVRDGLPDAATALEEARARAIGALQAIVVQAQERIDRVTFVPDQALTQLRRAASDLVRNVEAEAAIAFGTLMTATGDIESDFAKGGDQAVAVEARWRAAAAQAAAAIRAIEQRLAELVAELLGELFSAMGQADSAQQRLVQAARDAIAPALEGFELAVEEVPPFDLGGPDWAWLRTIGGFLEIADGWSSDGWAEQALSQWLKDIEAASGSDTWREAIDKAKADIASAGKALYEEIIKSGATVETIGAALDQGVAQLTDWAKEKGGLLETVATDLEAKLANLSNAPLWQDLGGTFEAAQNFAANANQQLTALTDALGGDSVQTIVDALDGAARDLGHSFEEAVKHAEHAIVADLKHELETAGRDLLAEGRATALELTRALASGINTDSLVCTREALGYSYALGKQVLDVTRSSAILNNLGAQSLNALSAMVPFDRLRDRLLPQLANLDFSDLFPDLCGLKLEHLFPELKIIGDKLDEYDWLKVRHGFDKNRLTAWSDVAVDKAFDGESVLIDLSPITISIVNARLQAHLRVEIGEGGHPVQDVWASIKGDWQVALSGKPAVTVREGDLRFGNDGRFDFDFDSENIVMADELKFITEALSALLPQEDGLTIMPLVPAGVSATLALPLPDLGTGAFTITGVTLYCNFGLMIADGFEIKIGAWLSRPDRPFGLAVLFLGGGGWAGVDVTYRPPGRFVTRVSIGISAGAFVALNLAFCSGSAGLLFTAGVDFYQDSEKGAGNTAIALGMLIWGEFSILCIASAYLRITASITYQDGSMTANGRVSVSIRISFFFTLSVNRQFARQFAASKSNTRTLAAPARKPTVNESVDLHFQTLDVTA